jgi:hypothetical protein
MIVDGIKDVGTFLNTIRRGCEAYAPKIGTWERLFTMDSAAMEEIGIPCKNRKLILQWCQKYRFRGLS